MKFSYMYFHACDSIRRVSGRVMCEGFQETVSAKVVIAMFQCPARSLLDPIMSARSVGERQKHLVPLASVSSAKKGLSLLPP